MMNLRNPSTFDSTGHLDTLPDLGSFKVKEKTLSATDGSVGSRANDTPGISSSFNTSK
ncbi:hypothetical protein BD410DRAFT_896711, partial [Rickenella mellea]